MPTFDIVSQVDMQEVRNAVDQAARELSTRFDFKGTDSSVELSGTELHLHSSTEDRLRAVVQVVEEKLVKRKVSLKALDPGQPAEAAKGTVRQTIALKAGLSSDHTKSINKWIKEHGPKGVSSSTQGDQVRVTGKKRDDLQNVIAGLREEDFGLPLQFENFRE
ncbi:MAG: YajQ family cyclic di-GMP-binding protein [Actinomycetota bacterium]|nr:YajQ family cyclic di-GMP-binding protein [Actinomycetota bacterium]